MKKLFSKIKENDCLIDAIDREAIPKNIKNKTVLWTFVISLIIAFPIILIFIELFKQFPPITWVYYLICILASLSICSFIALTSSIYYNLLKNYVEKEDVQKINLKYVFLSELFNPLYYMVCIVSFIILTFIVR